MGPPKPRAGTLAGGRGVGAGRGAGGARRVGRHGWRMASLLSTLPLPLLPVVAFSSTSHPQSGATFLSTISLEPPRMTPSHAHPICAHPGPRPCRRPCHLGFASWGCARSCPSWGLEPRHRRAPAVPACPWIALSSLLRAPPLPLLASPQPRRTHIGARAQSTSRWESAPQGLLSAYPLLRGFAPSSSPIP